MSWIPQIITEKLELGVHNTWQVYDVLNSTLENGVGEIKVFISDNKSTMQSECYIHIEKQFAFSPLRQQELRFSRRKYLCFSHSKPFNYFGGDDYVLFLKNNNDEYETFVHQVLQTMQKRFVS